MGKKLTSEDILKQFNKIHDNKYNYDKMIYVNLLTSIIITCPIHGDFNQKPRDHKSGNGCQKCGQLTKKNKLSLNMHSIIKQFNKIHNNKYSYNNVTSYINIDSNINIICPIHGNFYKSSYRHLMGSGCPTCYLERPSHKLSNTTDWITKANLKHNNKYDYSLVQYTKSHDKVNIICPIHDKFEQTAYTHLSGSGCSQCSNGCRISKQEQDYYDFLVELLGEKNVKQSDRTILNGKELDIYLPNHNLAIEYNGLYWHSSNKKEDDPKMRQYHLNKTKGCAEKGVDLLHINEGDNVELWKQVINNKLGLNKRIYARQTKIKEIDNNTCKKFLEENHLQGSCNSKVRLGIYQQGELYSVMTFGKARYSDADWELIRFCTKGGYTVVGGASKLLKMFKSTWKGVIISYANKRWSNGNLYNKLGFTLLHDSAPCYWYIKNGEMWHRSKFMKHKLAKQLKIFDNKLSEVDNMYNNGFRRIWDCGNKVYKL